MKPMGRRAWAAGIALIVLAGRGAAQDTHLLIVTGLSGEPQYAESFRAWASSLQAAAEKRPRASPVPALPVCSATFSHRSGSSGPPPSGSGIVYFRV